MIKRKAVVVPVIALALVAACSTAVETQKIQEPPALFEDSQVSALYVDGRDEASLQFIAGGSDKLAVSSNGEWEIVLQNTGDVSEFAASSDRVFAATGSGLFASTDGGFTWFEIAPGEFKNVSAVVANETSDGEFVLAIIATHASKGRGTFVATEIDGTWSFGAGGPDRSLSVLDDNTIVGARGENIVWAEPGVTLDWAAIPTGDKVGVMSADGASEDDFVAFVSNSRSQDVSVFVVKDGKNTVRTLPHSLAPRTSGCSPYGGYGPFDQCFQEVILSNEFQSDGKALLISPDGLLSSSDFGQEWNHHDIPDDTRIQAADWFNGEVYAITRSYVVENNTANNMIR